MNSKADLERFFERDIIEFLDSKNKGVDKFQEVLKILQEGEADLADLKFESLIKEYNDMSTNNVYKEIMFSKLADLTTKLEAELYKKKLWDSSLGEIIAKIIENGVFEGDMVNNIAAYEERNIQREEEREQQAKQDYKIKEELDKKIADSEKKLFILLRKEALVESIREYKNVKSCFEQYPSRFENQKSSIYNDLLSYYAQIKRLKKKLKDNPPKKKVNNDYLSGYNKKKYIKLDFLNDKVKEVKDMVRRGEFEEAKGVLLELKHNVESLPSDQAHLKRILSSKLFNMNQKIDLLKRNKKEAVE